MSPAPYRIRSIRLINFHNFIDETINLRDGGHLFLLGDNGCGKTTILDAVHYVLTAGRFMEWNSAARMSGAKRDGRRVQGIVLRYNLETGVMNKNGAISYVALELAGHLGKPLSLGMGISATAMDERVRFWGFIRQCPLSEIPFLVEERDRLRPCSRLEFKQKFGSSRGFLNSQKSYRREIGDRLFGGEESYFDICRFLHMGKAYREISAGAADYHELFKRLLPEPRTTIFSQIIEALRTLDESQAILDDLERKLEWITGLAALTNKISAHRQAILRYDWLLCRFSMLAAEDERRSVQERIAECEKRRSLHREKLAGLEKKDRLLEERLDTLKAKDSSGLVVQEKRVQADINEKKTVLSREKEELKQKKQQVRRSKKKLQQRLALYQKTLAAFLPSLAAHATSLPFSITPLLGNLDQCIRENDRFFPADFEINAEIEEADLALREIHTDLARLQDREEELKLIVGTREDRLAELEKQGEVLPGIHHYKECLQAFEQNLLRPRPLYLGLEWQSTVKFTERNHIEECIGREILGTFFFRRHEYGQARQIGVHFPGVRICGEEHMARELPEWMRLVFDLRNSDPDCLRCLAREMETDGLEPRVSLVDGKPFLAFRGHERAFYGHTARLIGEESRKKSLAVDIRKLKQEIKELRVEQRNLGREVRDGEQQQKALTDFKSVLTDTIADLRRISNTGREEEQTFSHFRELCKRQQESVDTLLQTLTGLKRLHQELIDRIAGEGLVNLERRIKKLKREKESNQTNIRKISQEIGANERDLEQLRQRLSSLGREYESLLQQKEESEIRLREILPEVEDIAHYVLKSKKGQQFKTREAIEKERNGSEIAAATAVNSIRERINNPEFGGGFRFSYEEESNELRDFREQSLTLILQQQQTALSEQKEVINERTRKLFRQIIMSDLLDYLRGHVGDLDRMMRRINNRLTNRSFGGQRYQFRLRPLDQYKHLITIIKKISSFDPAAEKELEHFFADHRDTFLATEVGAIPEELDYRNWYRYELEVSRLGDEGVVMDRRTKSVGSGGEQAVPNYLLILTIAHFLYQGKKIHLHTLLFDEAFYGIDAGRRDQLLGFATDLDLQLFVASPDQDGVRREVKYSTTLLVKKDTGFDVHLYPFHWRNPAKQEASLFTPPEKTIAFDREI